MSRQGTFSSFADVWFGNPEQERASEASLFARWTIDLPNDRLRELEQLASRIRRRLGIYLEQKIDILSIVELKFSTFRPDFHFIVIDNHDRTLEDNILAYTQFDPLQMGVRETIYRLAADDDPRARFVLAHEFGHLILHDLQRDRATKSDLETCELQFEREANIFAAAFLVPAWKTICMSVEQVSENFGVTRALAEWRLKQVHRLRAKERTMRRLSFQ